MQSRNNSPRFYLLDLARGIAALGIFFYHVAGKTKPFNALYVLVDFFFVLSGFVLYDQIPSTYNFSKFKEFTKKRIKRLVPTAYLGIIISYLVYTFTNQLQFITPEKKLHVDGFTFLLALLFLQFIVPSSAALIVTMWSLSVEIFVNIFFALTGIKRNIPISLLIISLISLSILLGNPTPNLTSGWIALARGFFGFSFGLITRNLHNKVKAKTTFQTLFSLVIGVILILLVSTSSVYFILLIPPSMSYLIYNLASIEIINDKVKLFCKLLGDFSYGIYIWHTPILYFVDIILSSVKKSDGYFIFKVLEISITLSLTFIFTWTSIKLFKNSKLS